jgi:hypothetical protein
MFHLRVNSKTKSASFSLTGLMLLTMALFLTGCKCNSQVDGQCSELTVSMAGTGSGRVTSVPDGINCEPECSQAFVTGTPVTLTASPYSGSNFADWSGGGCSGTGSCTVTMNESTIVTAEFNLIPTEISNLITPYVDESDMSDIRDGFSTIEDNDQWDFIHDGMDIYPDGDLKPFQAVCDGRVRWMYIGDEQVIVMLACNSTYTAEYNFESQAPNTGQIQLANIMVSEGQVVAQGDIIGRLYVGDPAAHVHFSLYKNWVPICFEPYFSPAAKTSLLNLLHVTYPGADLCYGANVTPAPLVTPYVNESDMTEINAGFSTEYSSSPWDFVHDGLDIAPQGDLKPFQAACAGTVDAVQLVQLNPGANWQVKVLIQCNDYVPNTGGYFIPFSAEYIFEPMTKAPPKGQQQLADITVIEGQNVAQGDIIGYLHDTHKGAHLQFGLVQFGSSDFSTLGVPRLPICPEPHFSTAARDSVLKLLHIAWPSANMCYQD